ncbi:hypothetical protein ANO11243_029220 [Dothideomycetidae sp. 11243]|nr:hypothetical protein ANO11243_029220 [fungal sp. No.11243]
MKYQYETVTGFFLQDDTATDAATFDYTDNYGLKQPSNDSTPPWQAFADKIASLDAEAPSGTSYRVLLFGRHGEGWHNVAEARFGTPAWDVSSRLPLCRSKVLTSPGTLLSPTFLRRNALH